MESFAGSITLMLTHWLAMIGWGCIAWQIYAPEPPHIFAMIACIIAALDQLRYGIKRLCRILE